MIDNLKLTIKINPIVLLLGNPLEQGYINDQLLAMGYNPQQINPTDDLPEGTVAIENYLSYLGALSPLDMLKAESALQARYFKNLADGNRLVLVETKESFQLSADLSRFVTSYSFPRPSGEEIARIYLDENLETSAKTVGYGRGLTSPELSIAIKQAKIAELKGNSLWQYLDRFRAQKLGLMGLTYIPVPERVKVGGLDLVLANIDRVKYCISPEGVTAGIPWPKGAIFIGIPGTGKSYIMQVVAAELGWPMIAVSIDKLAAGGAALLKKELELVEAMSPCVFILDEFEKLLSDRGDPLVLGVLLNWLQEHKSKVYTMAACNWAGRLPIEITRDERFGIRYGVGFPSENARLAILEIYLSRYDDRYADFSKLPEDDLRLMAENSLNFVAAELKSMVDTLAATTGMAGRSIELEDILEAMRNHSTMYRRDPTPIDLMLREIEEGCAPVESTRQKYIAHREIDICG